VRQGTLFAQAFDPTRLELIGDPKAITERIVAGSTVGAAALSASAAGPIVYRTGSSTLQSQFVWFDRSGKALEVVSGSDSDGFNASLAPDGRRLAISLIGVGGTATDIWLLDHGPPELEAQTVSRARAGRRRPLRPNFRRGVWEWVTTEATELTERKHWGILRGLSARSALNVVFHTL
jgi:hypothetical protein